MKITIHQPAFLPWLGLMSKINESDIFVVLDNVQFSKNSFDNRNRILVNDTPTWLTIPIKTKGKFKNNPMREVEIAHMSFRQRHWPLIKNNYKDGSPAILAMLKGMYQGKSNKLLEWQIGSMDVIKSFLGINTTTYYATNLGLSGKGSDLILNICRHFKAKEYLSGPKGIDYLDLNKFKENGIKVKFHHWDTDYPLSAIHYLLKLGTERTRDIMRNSYTIKKGGYDDD
jgi:hypothetical protein